jgi:tRNA(Arg) A34 adenosine deaminase TadA
LKGWLAWVAALPFFPARSESALPSPIPQPEAPSHQAFMKQADEMRTQALHAGDQGYGAVVVNATRNLSGCTLYATFTPCPMCQTAGYWANVDKVIVGEGLEDAGKPKYGC